MRKVALVLLVTITTALLLPTATVAATTVDLQALPGDGHLYTSGTIWNVINEQDAASIDNANTKIYIDSTWDGGKFLSSRGVLFMNSLGLPDYTQVATATLYFYVDAVTTNQTDLMLLFLSTTGGHPNYPLVQADYNKDWYTTSVGYVYTDALVAKQYNSVTLDVGYWLTKDDIANIVMMTSLDYSGDTPEGKNTITIMSAESANPPYIRVRYGDGTTTPTGPDVQAELNELKTMLGQVVNAQNNIQGQLADLKAGIGQKDAADTTAMNTKLDNIAKQLTALQQSSTTQDKSLASIVNQLGTLPALKTDTGTALAELRQAAKDMSSNVTELRQQVQDIRDGQGSSSGTTTTLLVIVLIGLVIVLFLLFSVKRSVI